MRRAQLSALLLTLLSGAVACEDPVECLADSSCESGLVCVNAQCVGTELSPSAESWRLYRDEMHNRLAADCGICHGVRGELPPTVYGEPRPEDEAEELQKQGATDLLDFPVQTGDSAWRIYLDDLTNERLFSSYLDTLQFINPDKPELSLLLAFGRGELNVNGAAFGPPPEGYELVAHPRVYDIALEGGEAPQPNCSYGFVEVERASPQSPADPNLNPPPPPPNAAQVSHQRLLAWASLDHSGYGGVWPFTLQGYQDHVEPLIAANCSCHKLAEEGISTTAKNGAFCFPAESTSRSDIYLWSSMINVTDPGSSALIHFLNGDYDHRGYTKEIDVGEFTTAVTNWVNDP